MQSTPYSALSPDELISYLARLFNDPEAQREYLDRLKGASDPPKEVYADPESPPWDLLYKWLAEDLSGEYLGAMLSVAERMLPEDEQLRAFRARLDEWAASVSPEEETVETPLPDDGGATSKIDVSQQAAQKEAPLDLDVSSASPLDSGIYATLDLGGAPSTMDVDDLLKAYPHIEDAYLQDALRLAAWLSEKAERPVDSVLLLAAMLASAERTTGLSTSRVVLETLSKQREASDVVALLELDSTYGISNFSQPSLKSTTARGVTAELRRVLAKAEELTIRTNPDQETVWPRHLNVALLVPGIVEPEPAAQQYLKLLGYDLSPIGEALLAYVIASGGGDAEAWRAVLHVAAPGGAATYLAGYKSDVVDPNAPDRLGIEREVQAICRVLASRQVSPPLSLGLFGDWGSGKSFFMAKMRAYIDEVAQKALEQAQREKRLPAFCARVVQIEFNAWHFADANLWASLVSHIFDALFGELTGKAEAEKQTKARLERELSQAKGLVQEAERALSDAEKDVHRAEACLRLTRRKRMRQERTLYALLQDVGSLLKDDADTQEKLKEATNALGYPEAAASYATLEETASALQTFSKRIAAVGHLLVRAPFALTGITFLLIALIALPFLVDFLLDRFGVEIQSFAARMTEVSTFVVTVAGWVGLQLKRVEPHVKKIEDGLKKAKEVRARRQQQEAAGERRELDIARGREEVARQTLQEAQAKLQKLQRELSEISPGRQLYRLIEERSRDDRYSKHLGIISLIRKDFERMSKLLRDLADQPFDPDDGELPIQRIILYVDDLDRCRPQRVVEVLEAIHLLMAFPLFVVVVGVDPRWLRRCLEQHYPYLLSDSDHRAAGDRRADAPEPRQAPVRSSTPQDYLEKIFQIPFALRPIEPDGFRALMQDLLAPLPEPPATPAETSDQSEQETPTPSDQEEGEEQADGEKVEETGKEEADADARQEGGAQPAAAGGDGAAGAMRPVVVLNPQQLEFTPWEQEDIKRLAPLFRTPRAVKRFVNIYRLLRAGLEPDEVDAFEGSADAPGQYRVALVLLAVVTGFPNQAPDFLQRLNWWLPKPWEQGPDSSWDDFLETLDLPRDLVEQRALSAEGLRHGEPASALPDEADDAAEAAWRRFCDRLRQVAGKTDDVSFLPFEEEILETWARRVARYSFSFNLRQVL